MFSCTAFFALSESSSPEGRKLRKCRRHLLYNRRLLRNIVKTSKNCGAILGELAAGSNFFVIGFRRSIACPGALPDRVDGNLCASHCEGRFEKYNPAILILRKVMYIMKNVSFVSELKRRAVRKVWL